VDTQALLGEQVLVLSLAAGWAQVAIPDQPTPIDSRGYPAWIPAEQLSALPPPPAALEATVVTPTAWLRDREDIEVLEVSYGTRLPVLSDRAGRVGLGLPGGASLAAPADAVAISAAGAPALAPTAAAVIGSARGFLGLRYLWGGTSGFGYDCSGLVYLVYKVHGVLLPRDADPQMRAGSVVGQAASGDLLFFVQAGSAYHVALYLGGGRALDSPDIAQPVEEIGLDQMPARNDYAGARRVLAG